MVIQIWSAVNFGSENSEFFPLLGNLGRYGAKCWATA